ncbi:MAG: bifunctional folylpolyglutamate synthase/dihydrofolate synthase [Lachnospiraceae bacterium]|nr:bifunctional folylpolyglutamate synthase/dihydrofolate synthase [Lachnospiraceae bacterium]
MTEREAEDYLLLLKSRGSHPGLDRVFKLAEELGHPEKKLKFVHIAGTNGKGSVGAFLASILKAAGFRTGHYFSPSLSEERDAIRIGGKPLTKKAWREGLEALREAEERLAAKKEALPTVFEAVTLLAFRTFEAAGCDIVITECGMGGAGDATNIIPPPLLAVFTPISMDHMAFLGHSLKAIAKEKSGIIKPGSAVLSAKQPEEAARVLESAAEGRLCYPEEAAHVRLGLKGAVFDCGGYKKLSIALAGSWQPQNAALAVKAAELLKDRGFPVSEKALRKGLADTEWFGRFSLLKYRPPVIADGAHNEAGAAALAESLKVLLPGKGCIFLMGVLADKEYEKELALLLPLALQLICITPPENPRALPGLELAEAAGRISPALPVSTADSVEEGLELAELLSGGKLPIVCCGSLSWMDRLQKAFKKEKEK